MRNEIEVKMEDGHLSFKSRGDGQPVQEYKNKFKITKNNVFYVTIYV